MMKIIIDFPPFYEQACKVFDLTGTEPVFTFGDVLYNPYDNKLDPAILTHEEVHSKQQSSDPNGWWDKYFLDSEFRLNQEIPAYVEQYKVAKKYIKDKNKLFKYLCMIAKDLSSPMYGSLVSYNEAIRLIKS